MKPPYCVAVVDDDINIRRLIEVYLRKENYQTYGCESAEEALSLLELQSPDLWVLDIMLPKMDGYELCRRIRATSKTEVPIIIISAKDDEVDRILGIHTGGDDYLTKPFSPNELVARVNRSLLRMERLLGGAPRGSNVAAKGGPFDTLAISYPEHRVFWKNEEVELSTKEFAVLEYLYRRPNASFSREELLNAIWGVDYFGSDRTVDHVVKRIRKKIPELPLENVWGYGYKLRNTMEYIK